MTKLEWAELSKEIDDTPNWNKELYKIKNGKRVRKHNLALAHWRILYNDGSVFNGPKGYGDIRRKNIKSISVVSNDKAIHTVKVKDDSFLIRLRNLIKNDQKVDFGNLEPKRCFVLATKGNIAFVWDDGDIDELKEWGDQEPYRKPTLRNDEN